MPCRRGVVAVFAVLISAWHVGFLAAAPLVAADPASSDPPGEVVALRGRWTCLDALAATPGDPASDHCNHPGERFELRQQPVATESAPEDEHAASEPS
jgi:hypothetical protein